VGISSATGTSLTIGATGCGSTIGSGLRSTTGATGVSSGSGAEAVFLAVLLRGAAVFFVARFAFGAGASGAGASATGAAGGSGRGIATGISGVVSAGSAVLRFLGLLEAAGDFRRVVFLGGSASGNNDGVSVDSLITNVQKFREKVKNKARFAWHRLLRATVQKTPRKRGSISRAALFRKPGQ
jgi:hypothetical protein